MKFNSPLTLGAIAALLPLVTNPLPGQSTPINLAQLSISPVDETIDLGQQGGGQVAQTKLLRFALPKGDNSYSISPDQLHPFALDSISGTVNPGGSREVTIRVELAPAVTSTGVFNRVIEIRSGKQLIKKVLLKVKVVPTAASGGGNGDRQPTSSPQG
jgi:hypothetical protein